MFYLHISNRTEHLLRQLAEIIKVSERKSLFEKEVFLIQSQGMERMISQYLSTIFTSWCNFECLLPREFIDTLARKSGVQLEAIGYEREIMVWRIEKLLRSLNSAFPKPLLRYLQGVNSELKRFQLSQQMAHLFDQYQMMRPDMLAEWEKGLTQTGLANEVWQMQLWQALSQQQEGPHRGKLLEKAIEALRKGRGRGELPARISIFGLNSMVPLFMEYLNELSEFCNVHLYLLSPCREYWGDVESRRAQLRRKLVSTPTDEKYNEPFEAHHPLLSSMGRQGRDFQKLLLEQVDFTLEFESYEDPGAEGEFSLLKKLQRDLLEGEVPPASPPNTGKDDSIHIVSCHSKFREITILKDYIHKLLATKPSLELRDIVVMAPDIQEYAALIPAVFDDLQHSISDRSLAGRNKTMAAFSDFMEILSGRFGWLEVLSLLEKDVVSPHFELSNQELQTIRKWIVEAGIRWGLSSDQRQSSGLPGFTENTWAAGLQRLLMGYAVLEDVEMDGVLPVAGVEGINAQAIGGLCHFLELMDRAHGESQRAHTLKEWSALLLSFCRELFGEADDSDLLELRSVLSELAKGGKFHDQKVSFDVIHSWLASSTNQSRSSSGFLRGQLTFCSMLPMRSIPFKVICLLGLNDGAFPKADHPVTFDLMAEKYRLGDRSPREDDRYQFLEAILAARECLYLSYIGQSIISNERIPPSVVVTELLEVLEAGYGQKEMVTFHPLHPFNYRYFLDENRDLYSYNDHYCRMAQRMSEGGKKRERWWRGRLDFIPEFVQLTDLLQFVSHPQRYFLKKCLSIDLSGDESFPSENEAFSLEGLERYQVDNELLASLFKGDTSEALYRKLQLQGRWPLGKPGEIEFDKKRRDLSEFIQSINAMEIGAQLGDVSFDFSVNGVTLRGVMKEVHEGGILLMRYGKLGGGDLLRAWVHYLLLEYFDITEKVYLITKDHRVVFSDCPRQPDLTKIIELYLEGCQRPSAFYLKPALSYILQLQSARAKLPPLKKAQKVMEDLLSAGQDPYLSLLLQTEEESLLDEEFETHCLEIMMPIWRNGHEF